MRFHPLLLLLVIVLCATAPTAANRETQKQQTTTKSPTKAPPPTKPPPTKAPPPPPTKAPPPPTKAPPPTPTKAPPPPTKAPPPPTKAAPPTKRRKILVTNVGVGGSQNLVMGRLADRLASRPGNDVTLLQYEILPNAKKIKLEHAKQITFMANEDVEAVRRLEEALKTTPWAKHGVFNPGGMATMMALMEPIQSGCANLLMNHSALVEQLKTEKFDAIIIHLADTCTFGLSKYFGIKATALFSTAFLMDPMAGFTGVESPSSYVPIAILESTDQMGFLERFRTFLMRPLLGLAFEMGVLRAYDKIFERRFGANFPKFRDIIRETQLFLINSDSFFEYPRPMQANIIEVGGFTMTKSEPLKPEWLKLLENEKTDGAVLFSLGTVANTSGMPIEMKMAFVNAFKRFPRYTFIMRIEGEFPEGKEVSNIHLTKWVQQKDLLGHPKLKAFITHGGYNSLTEATFRGVPLVVFPLFGDHGPNAKRIERRGHGVTLDKNSVTEQKIYEALDHVLNDKEVERRAKFTAKLIQNKPFSSEETAMRWIEFLADYKDLDVLKPESRRMSFIKYHNLDVIATLLGIVGLKFYVIYLFCVRCYNCCRRTKSQGTSAAKKRQ